MATERSPEFLEKPSRDQIDTDEINAGAYLLERSVLDRIPPDRAVSIEREVFPELIGDGLYGIRLEGYWIDIRHLPPVPRGELGHPRGAREDRDRPEQLDEPMMCGGGPARSPPRRRAPSPLRRRPATRWSSPLR